MIDYLDDHFFFFFFFEYGEKNSYKLYTIAKLVSQKELILLK